MLIQHAGIVPVPFSDADAVLDNRRLGERLALQEDAPGEPAFLVLLRHVKHPVPVDDESFLGLVLALAPPALHLGNQPGPDALGSFFIVVLPVSPFVSLPDLGVALLLDSLLEVAPHGSNLVDLLDLLIIKNGVCWNPLEGPSSVGFLSEEINKPLLLLGHGSVVLLPVREHHIENAGAVGFSVLL